MGEDRENSNTRSSKRTQRWAMMVAGIWIQCASGSSYTFSIYSSSIKSALSYDQSTLDTIASAKDVGANLGVLSGILYSAVPGSPWLVHVAGAVQCFVGYLMLWLCVTGRVETPAVWQMCVYMFLASHAQTFFNTADVVTAVRNFPKRRGTAVGLMKGFLGLSGAILIQVYETIFRGQPTSYILLLAILPTVVSLLLMYFIKVDPKIEPDEKTYLNYFSLIAMILAGYLVVIIIWENIQTPGSIAYIVTFLILLLTLLSPLSVALRAQSKTSWLASQSPNIDDTTLMDDDGHVRTTKGEELYSRDSDGTDYHQISIDDDMKPSQREDNLTVLQAMLTWDFWLLFTAMACGMGSGLATINNMSQLGESLGYTTTEISTLVSLWSIWNFLGRFGAGYVSEYFLHRAGYARPLFMVITMAAMAIGHGVISSGFRGALYVGSILVGVCYGSQWSLMPTISSEIFGLRNLGTLFNTISIASPIGSYILSVWVVGYIYDLEASDKESCSGTHCFMVSFLIMASAALIGCLVASVLYFRTRRFYQEVVYIRVRSAQM
ncbi:hypothetical protein AMTRI_Chr03g146710 [Amborella trichopoda]